MQLLNGKILAIDLEVSSFNKRMGALTQISAIALNDGNKVDEINLLVNPFSYNRIVEVTDFNLTRQNRTVDEVRNFPSSSEQFLKFRDFLMDNLNDDETFSLLGHNVINHDSIMLHGWFRDNEYPVMEFLDYHHLDTLTLARHMRAWGLLDGITDLKLGTLCKYFSIPLENWHNATDDIQATLALYDAMRTKIQS